MADQFIFDAWNDEAAGVARALLGALVADGTAHLTLDVLMDAIDERDMQFVLDVLLATVIVARNALRFTVEGWRVPAPLALDWLERVDRERIDAHREHRPQQRVGLLGS